MKFFEGFFGKKPEEQKPKGPELETQGAYIDPSREEIKIDLSQFPDLKKEAPKMSDERRSMAGFSRDVTPAVKRLSESDSVNEAETKKPEPIMFSSQKQAQIEKEEEEKARNRELII